MIFHPQADKTRQHAENTPKKVDSDVTKDFLLNASKDQAYKRHMYRHDALQVL